MLRGGFFDFDQEGFNQTSGLFLVQFVSNFQNYLLQNYIELLKILQFINCIFLFTLRNFHSGDSVFKSGLYPDNSGAMYRTNGN